VRQAGRRLHPTSGAGDDAAYALVGDFPGGGGGYADQVSPHANCGYLLDLWGFSLY